MANRAHFADALTPGFRKIYNDKFTEIPMRLNDLFTVGSSGKDTEKDSALTGFGLATEVGEGQPIPYEDPIQMYDKTYTHVKYGKGFKITLEMYEDDLYSVMSKRPAALGRAMRRTAENQAAQQFINAFTTTGREGDGVPMCSTVHPRSDGGSSQSNASATSIVLNEDNLETAMIASRKQLDDRGQKIGIMPKTLLIPIELNKTAHLIVDSEKRQGTADNDMNPYKGKFKIIDWDYLTSTTAWFLIDDSEAELNWFWRRKPTFKDDELFDTEFAVYKSTMRLSYGHSDWRGVWGSKGDASAYAD